MPYDTPHSRKRQPQPSIAHIQLSSRRWLRNSSPGSKENPNSNARQSCDTAGMIILTTNILYQGSLFPKGSENPFSHLKIPTAWSILAKFPLSVWVKGSFNAPGCNWKDNSSRNKWFDGMTTI